MTHAALDFSESTLAKMEQPEQSENMKLGKTERETLDLNGWTVGDILEGDEGYGPHRILITAVGEERFLCRWNYLDGKGWQRESGQTTLSCRDWKKVSQ